MKTSFSNKIAIAATSVILVAASGVSIGAQAAPDRNAQHVNKLDANKDGRITREEAAARPRLAKQFDKIDSSQDGAISREEILAFQQKRMLMQLKAVDTDNDSRISRAEANAKAPRLAKHFDQIDTNRDGYLTKEEMAATRKMMKREEQ